MSEIELKKKIMKEIDTLSYVNEVTVAKYINYVFDIGHTCQNYIIQILFFCRYQAPGYFHLHVCKL